MKILVVEDDSVCAKLLKLILERYGSVDVAEDGVIGLSSVSEALEQSQPYDLICLDIMMPNMDGHAALQKIREVERLHGFNIGQGAKILMTTALSDHKTIIKTFRGECDGYIVKPIEKNSLNEKLKELELI